MQNINELIGIIKGINFDGVINDKEVVRLQAWVDKNRNLAYDKRQMELIKRADSALEDHVIDEEEKELMLSTCEEFLQKTGDNTSRIYELNGILAEEEQAELLDLFSTRIRNAQFENKLSYLCKLVRDKKNIGTDLIDVLNNESAMNEIHSRAERNLMQAVGSYNRRLL